MLQCGLPVTYFAANTNIFYGEGLSGLMKQVDNALFEFSILHLSRISDRLKDLDLSKDPKIYPQILQSYGDFFGQTRAALVEVRGADFVNCTEIFSAP